MRADCRPTADLKCLTATKLGTGGCWLHGIYCSSTHRRPGRSSWRRDNNAITNATNELKRVLILAGDFVHVVPQRGNYVDRVVVSSPVYRHTLIVVLFSRHTFDRLLIDFTRTRFQIRPVFRSR